MLVRGPSLVAGRSDSLPPPPAYIRLPRGEIRYAARTHENPHAGKRSRRTGAQKAGLAYQRKVEAFLGDCAAAGNVRGVVCAPWFHFVDDGGQRRYCQPDILLDLPNFAQAVCEIKLRWTSDAWWQVRKLYLPVLRSVYPHRELFPLVICRSYDPAIRIPEEVALVDHPAECRSDAFNVFVWRPQ